MHELNGLRKEIIDLHSNRSLLKRQEINIITQDALGQQLHTNALVARRLYKAGLKTALSDLPGW